MCATLFTAFFFPLFALQFSICCLCCFPPRPARFVYVVQGALVACLDVVALLLFLQQEVARPMTKPEQRSTGRQARKPVGIGCTVVEQAEAVTGD